MIPDGFFTPGEETPSGADILDTAVGWIDGYRMVYLRTANNWSAYSPDVEGIFADEQGKMNLDIAQSGGAFLVVSQFTLLADTRKGRRPSFIRAADPRTGEALYRYVVERLRAAGFGVETGEFGAHMLVEIANDGPVTIILDTDQ